MAGNELVFEGNVIEGELVDETCSCGKPGRLIVEPYQQDIFNETVVEVMCDGCEYEACMDI
jgi:hypothetical protein